MATKDQPSTWDKVQGRMKEVAGRAAGNSRMAKTGEEMQRAGDAEQAAEQDFLTRPSETGQTNPEASNFPANEVDRDDVQEGNAPADSTDPLEVDGEMGQGGGRQFDPDPLRSGSTPASQTDPDGTTYDRDPGRPNSQEDRDVEHRSRRTEGDPGYLDPDEGYKP